MSLSSRKASSSRTADSPDSTASTADAEVLPLHLRTFIRDLIRKGMWLDPCGANALPRPQWAIFYLEPKYGKEGLLRLCREIYRLPAPIRDHQHDCILKTVYGMLYHIGDAATLAELEALRSEELMPIPPLYGPNPTNDPYRDTLIDSLRFRLALPLEEQKGKFGEIFETDSDFHEPVVIACLIGFLILLVVVGGLGALGYWLFRLIFGGS